MPEENIVIQHPKRPGFIMLSHDLKSAFQSLFNLKCTISAHDKDTFQISFSNKIIFFSEETDIGLMNGHDIAVSISEIIPPVRPFNREDFNKARLAEEEIESEWKHCMCSGE